jgi:hypothetical protein
MLWIVLAILLAVSSTLNAFQVFALEDLSAQLFRGGLSVTMAILAALSLRKGLAERARDHDGTPGAIAAAKATRQGLMPVAAIAIVILIVVGLGVVGRGPSLTMPENLIGNSRFNGPTIERLQETLESEVGSGAILGVYGHAGQPRFVVVAVPGGVPPDRDPIGEFAASVQPPGAATTDLSSRTTRTIGSVTYSCVRFSLPPGETSPSGTLCVWDDGDSSGMVGSYDPSLDASVFADDVYAAVVE